jgi:N-acetylneuraminic acid mutarotase
LYGDTWRSTDGVQWDIQSDGTGWGKRAYPEVAIVDNSIILTGGQGLFTFYNDVWRSDDFGKIYKQVNANAPWGVRAGHYTMVVNDTILLFAGAKNSLLRSFYNDLWISSDKGSTWQLQATLPADMGRAGMQVVNINNVLYFMGGDHDKPVFRPNWAGRRNDVWSSSDLGKTWTLLGNTNWIPRTGQQCSAFKGSYIVCIGGEGAGSDGKTPVLLHDVWMWNPATDKVNEWTLVSNEAWGCSKTAPSCGKDDFELLNRNDELWTFGGDEELSLPTPQDNDVWKLIITLPSSESEGMVEATE